MAGALVFAPKFNPSPPELVEAAVVPSPKPKLAVVADVVVAAVGAAKANEAVDAAGALLVAAAPPRPPPREKPPVAACGCGATAPEIHSAH